MKRRQFLFSATASLSFGQAFAAGTLPQVEVYKNPDCGCCSGWVDHLKSAGFPVKVHETPDTSALRKRYGIPEQFGSCHTGVVGAYALEGHVPADEIKRLLAQKPVAAGLSVPGMPVGSPGMEVGSRKDAYQVLLIDKAGRPSVFAAYPKS